MRAAVAFAALAVLLPVGGLGASVDCPNVADARALMPVAEALAAAHEGGFDLSLAQPIAPLHVGDVPLPPLPGDSPCLGKIRPGAALIIERAFLCTANWVFQDAAGVFYIGTAGHCIPGLDWDVLEIWGLDGDFGDPVFRKNGGIGQDFALLRVDPAFNPFVDPTLCHWGGPSAPADLGQVGELREDLAALHYGWGYMWGSQPTTRPRAGTLQPLAIDPTWELVGAEVTPGDSGSPLMLANGQAALIVTHSVLVPGPVPSPVAGLGAGIGVGTRIDQALALAEAGTGLDLALVTSPHAVDLTGLSVPP